MKNSLFIRTENVEVEYFNLPHMLIDLGKDNSLKYVLIVNNEEVEISKKMADGMVAFFDEYNKEVSNPDCYCIGTWRCPNHKSRGRSGEAL